MDWTRRGIKAYHIIRSRLGSRYGCMNFEDIYQDFKKRLYSETYLVDRAPECNHNAMSGGMYKMYNEDHYKDLDYCPKCGDKL